MELLAAAFAAVTTYFSGTLGMVELVATAASAICVYLAVRHNMWTWFFGIIGVLLFGWLFFQVQLYSDAGLQILFFLPMQFLGWFWWKREANKAQNDHVVLAMKPFFILATVIGIMGATGINGYLMANFTDASFPYADAFTTWMSIAAQLLMIAKYRECWVYWVLMDIVAIGVYFAKGLVVTSGLYVVFLVLATMGGIAWYRDFAKQKEARATKDLDEYNANMSYADALVGAE